MAELVPGVEVEPDERPYDPWDKDAHTANVIMQLKIYDLLLAILTDANPDAARVIAEAHQKGVILGANPQFSHFAPIEDE